MNKYLKRGAAILLSGAMCLSMAACGDKGGSKDSKNETKTLAQELGYGYLSDYHDLDVELDWINSGNVSTAQGKLYFAGQFYNDEAGTTEARLYAADPATGEVTEIPMTPLNSDDNSSENLQAVTVSPDGSSYWTIIDRYVFTNYEDDTTVAFNAEAGGEEAITEEAAGEEAAGEEAPAEEAPAEEAAGDEAPAEEAEAPIDDTAEAEASTTEEPAIDEGYTEGNNQETYTAYKYDMSGNQLLEIDLTEIVSADQDWFYPQ